MSAPDREFTFGARAWRAVRADRQGRKFDHASGKPWEHYDRHTESVIDDTLRTWVRESPTPLLVKRGGLQTGKPTTNDAVIHACARALLGLPADAPSPLAGD